MIQTSFKFGYGIFLDVRATHKEQEEEKIVVKKVLLEILYIYLIVYLYSHFYPLNEMHSIADATFLLTIIGIYIFLKIFGKKVLNSKYFDALLVGAVWAIKFSSSALARSATARDSKQEGKTHKSASSTRVGNLTIKGGLLPKKITFGNDFEIYYDGVSTPRRSGHKGGKTVIKHDGNIQVIFSKEADQNLYSFEANKVETYKK